VLTGSPFLAAGITKAQRPLTGWMNAIVFDPFTTLISAKQRQEPGLRGSRALGSIESTKYTIE
jgi:hypothetical protein